MSKLILDRFGKQITEAVKDRSRMNELVRHIETYFDKNNAIVFAQGPAKPLIFAANDKEALYRFTGINPTDVLETLKKVDSIKASWKLLNDPFIILSVFVIRELQIQKKERERDLVIMFLAMKSYSGRQKVYFKFGANDQIMAYTLNNLTDKYKYKTLKNNYAVVKDIVLNSHSVYTSLLIKGEDDMLNIYFPQMYNRINKVLRNIAVEYYKNRDDKKYLNTAKTYDDELGGTLDFESSGGVIEQLAENTCNFFLTSTVNMKLVRTVADRNGIPYVSVYQTLIAMRKDENPADILKLMTNIITCIYEADNALLARVCSKDFAISAIKQLSVSNSSSKSLESVKTSLDRILETHCSKYAATQRLATKMSYRNAIYTYCVYILIANKCG
jgi:hypothetical protein